MKNRRYIMDNKKVIYTILGPSGSGKTTLGNYINNKLNIPECISTTTREKREGEIEGQTYYYVNKKKFDELEKVEEVEYAGNHYCLTKKEIEEKLEENDRIFVIMDKHGIEQMKKLYPDKTRVIYVYVNPIILIKRMFDRGDSLKNIFSRVWNAIKTGELTNHYFADHIIRNYKLKKAKKKIKKIVCN
jgi:guanylate kinase